MNFGRPVVTNGAFATRSSHITLIICYSAIQSLDAYFAVSVCSVVVEELEISDVRHNRIGRSRLTQFHAVRPALILLLTPLIFLPVPVVLATKVCPFAWIFTSPPDGCEVL